MGKGLFSSSISGISPLGGISHASPHPPRGDQISGSVAKKKEEQTGNAERGGLVCITTNQTPSPPGKGRKCQAGAVQRRLSLVALIGS